MLPTGVGAGVKSGDRVADCTQSKISPPGWSLWGRGGWSPSASFLACVSLGRGV